MEQDASDSGKDRDPETFKKSVDQESAALKTGGKGAAEDPLSAGQSLAHPLPVDGQHREGPDAIGQDAEQKCVTQEGIGDHRRLAPAIGMLAHAGWVSMTATWPLFPRSSAGTPA